MAQIDVKYYEMFLFKKAVKKLRNVFLNLRKNKNNKNRIKQKNEANENNIIDNGG